MTPPAEKKRRGLWESWGPLLPSPTPEVAAFSPQSAQSPSVFLELPVWPGRCWDITTTWTWGGSAERAGVGLSLVAWSSSCTVRRAGLRSQLCLQRISDHRQVTPRSEGWGPIRRSVAPLCGSAGERPGTLPVRVTKTLQSVGIGREMTQKHKCIRCLQIALGGGGTARSWGCRGTGREGGGHAQSGLRGGGQEG